MKVKCFMVLLLLYSCSGPSKDELLTQYLITHFNRPEDRFPKAIVVVAEDGCIHCDRAFADLVRLRTSNPDILFVVRIEGSAVDMHGFMEESERMHFDDDRSFKQLGILAGSGLILMEESHIDTIIPIQLEGIEEQLSCIESALDAIRPYKNAAPSHENAAFNVP